MFTSEAELQWCLKVGREALEMIMCFIFFIIGMVGGGGGGQNRLVRLLEELVRTEMALNSRPGWVLSSALEKNQTKKTTRTHLPPVT